MDVGSGDFLAESREHLQRSAGPNRPRWTQSHRLFPDNTQQVKLGETHSAFLAALHLDESGSRRTSGRSRWASQRFVWRQGSSQAGLGDFIARANGLGSLSPSASWAPSTPGRAGIIGSRSWTSPSTWPTRAPSTRGVRRPRGAPRHAPVVAPRPAPAEAQRLAGSGRFWWERPLCGRL